MRGKKGLADGKWVKREVEKNWPLVDIEAIRPLTASPLTTGPPMTGPRTTGPPTTGPPTTGPPTTGPPTTGPPTTNSSTSGPQLLFSKFTHSFQYIQAPGTMTQDKEPRKNKLLRLQPDSLKDIFRFLERDLLLLFATC